MKAQCLQMMVRVANWSIELFSHETKRGLTKNQIYKDVNGNIITDSEAEKNTRYQCNQESTTFQ